jgi:cell division protein FtsB
MTVNFSKIIKWLRAHSDDLQDARMLGLGLFVIVVLLVTWSGIKAIGTNYQLQKQITALKQQNSLQNLRNQNLRLQNDYYNTDQYLDLSARRNFGLGAHGETELLVPKSVAMAHTVDLKRQADKPSAQNARPTWQQNFQAWIDFFLHRNQPSSTV